MKYLSIALIYIAFFALIALAVYATNSGWPLIALVFTPSYNQKNEKNN